MVSFAFKKATQKLNRTNNSKKIKAYEQKDFTFIDDASMLRLLWRGESTRGYRV